MNNHNKPNNKRIIEGVNYDPSKDWNENFFTQDRLVRQRTAPATQALDEKYGKGAWGSDYWGDIIRGRQSRLHEQIDEKLIDETAQILPQHKQQEFRNYIRLWDDSVGYTTVQIIHQYHNGTSLSDIKKSFLNTGQGIDRIIKNENYDKFVDFLDISDGKRSSEELLEDVGYVALLSYKGQGDHPYTKMQVERLNLAMEILDEKITKAHIRETAELLPESTKETFMEYTKNPDFRATKLGPISDAVAAYKNGTKTLEDIKKDIKHYMYDLCDFRNEDGIKKAEETYNAFVELMDIDQ